MARRRGLSLIVFATMVSVTLNVGCGVHIVNYDTANLLPGLDARTISIGDIFFEREVMTGKKNVGDPNNSVFAGDAYRIEMVVEAVNKEKLKLGYSEYMKKPSPYGYYQFSEWLKKPAFSRTLEYDLKESAVVSYKNYDFEIINIQGSKVTYKRIK